MPLRRDDMVNVEPGSARIAICSFSWAGRAGHCKRSPFRFQPRPVAVACPQAVAASYLPGHSRYAGLGRCCRWRQVGCVGWGQGTREALVGQLGAQAGGDVLHRGGWVRSDRSGCTAMSGGSPHVSRAGSVHDAFCRSGVTCTLWTASWQMDAARKQMEGRWAEWGRRGGACRADRLARRLRVGAASIRDYRALGADARGDGRCLCSRGERLSAQSSGIRPSTGWWQARRRPLAGPGIA